MPDKVYEVKITTPYDDAGAKAAQADLSGIAQQAEKVGASAGTATAGIAGAEEATGRFVDSAGKLRETNGRFVQVGEDAEEAGKHIGEASHEADHFIASLKAGVGIDLGHRFIEGIAEVPARFREAIAEGVHFNQEMESLGLNLAGAFRAAQPEKHLNFAAAQAEGSHALDLLREKANRLGLDMHALGESLSINLASLSHAGVTDLEQQINLITLLQQVTASKGISGFQATRDIIDLLNGQANRTILGKELEPLGVNNETIKQAKEQGQLYEFLTSKFGAYTEAAGAYADTFAAAQQRLKNETQQLYGEISKPVFEATKEAYQTLAVEIEKPEVREGLRAIGYDAATIVSGGAGLLRWAVDNAGALTTLGEAVGVAALAWAAFKAAAVVGTIGARTAEWIAETLAVGENTVALEANAVARATVNEAGAVGAVEGVMSAEAATATGVTIGGAVAGVLQGAAALAIGYAIGSAISRHIASKADAELTAAGEQSIAGSQKLSDLQNGIESASTDAEQAKKRKELQDLIAQTQKDLDAKKNEVGVGVDELTGETLYSEAQKSAVTALEEQLNLAKHLNEEFDRLAGKNPLADPKAKRDNRALEEYHHSPEYLLEQAEASGDQQQIDDRTYDLKVAHRKKKLMSGENPLSEDDAEREAQAAETAAEGQKEREKDAKQKERDDAKAQREADQAARQKERDDARAAADEKQRADALVSEREEIAIMQARARGDEDTANALEKQRDIHREIVRLMQAGVSYSEAQALAAQKVEAANKLADEKAEDRASRHHARPAHEPHHRRGEHEGVPTVGYHARPGDAGYAGAGSSTDGFVDANPPTSSVSATALQASGNARLPDLLPRGLGALNALGIGPLAPTAAASLAPVLDTMAAANAAAQPDGAATPGSPLSLKSGVPDAGNDPFSQAASKFGGAASEKLGHASETLDELTDQFGGLLDLLNGRLEKLQTQINNAQSQNANQS